MHVPPAAIPHRRIFEKILIKHPYRNRVICLFVLILAILISVSTALFLWIPFSQAANFPYAAFVTSSITLYLTHLGLLAWLKDRGNISFNPYTISDMRRRMWILLYAFPLIFLFVQIYLSSYGILPNWLLLRRPELVIVVFLMQFSAFLFYHIGYGFFLSGMLLNERLYRYLLRRLDLPCSKWHYRIIKRDCKSKCPFCGQENLQETYHKIQTFFEKFPVAMCNENANKNATNSIQGMASFLLYVMNRLTVECDALRNLQGSGPNTEDGTDDPDCIQIFLPAFLIGYSVIPHGVRVQDLSRFDIFRVQGDLFDLLHDARPLRIPFKKGAGFSFFLLRRACMAGILAAGMHFDIASKGNTMIQHYHKQMRKMLITLFFRFEDMAYHSGSGKEDNLVEELHTTGTTLAIADIYQDYVNNRNEGVVAAIGMMDYGSHWELALSMFCLSALGLLHGKIFPPWPESLSVIPEILEWTKAKESRLLKDAVSLAFESMIENAVSAMPMDGRLFTKQDLCLARTYALLMTRDKDDVDPDFFSINGKYMTEHVVNRLDGLYRTSGNLAKVKSAQNIKADSFISLMRNLDRSAKSL